MIIYYLFVSWKILKKIDGVLNYRSNFSCEKEINNSFFFFN